MSSQHKARIRLTIEHEVVSIERKVEESSQCGHPRPKPGKDLGEGIAVRGEITDDSCAHDPVGVSTLHAIPVSRQLCGFQ